MISTTSEGRLDFGARTVPGPYWFASGGGRKPYAARVDTAAGDLRHCFSYERSQTSIKNAALELIAAADEKIFLASFRFVDDDLRDALRRAAARLRGGVYVITSIVDRDLRQTIDFTPTYEEDEEEDWFDEADPAAGPQDVNAQEDKKHYRELISSGVWVRGHPEFHAKFLVVDDRAALVSSANLEATALADAVDRPGRRPGFDAVTGESGVVTTRRADADALARFFARMWYSECVWDAPPGKGYQLSRRTPVPVPFAVPRSRRGEPGPIWTGGGDRLILDAIREIGSLARKELVLASFSTKGLEEHPDLLFDPVRDALGRGVRVRLLLRSRNFAAARATAGRLAGWGVEVYGDDKTHAKCALADSRHGAVFSANFDAEHGIYSGVEMGMRLDGEEALADVAHFFDHCIDHAPHRLVADPAAAAASTSLFAPALRAWPLSAELKVSCTDGAWAALRSTTGPLLFTTRDGSDLTLHADGGKWSLTGPTGGGNAAAPRRLALIEAPAHVRPGQPPTLLDDWLEGGRRSRPGDPYRDHRRGLCPATLIRV